MSAISDRYRKLAADLTAKIEAVPADGWDSPSPCEGWSARDVVRHILETYEMFLGRAGTGVPSGPSVDDDPAVAWANGRDALLAALENPELAEASYDTPMGPFTLERSTDMFLCADALVHAWDIAKATGGDEAIDAGECRSVHQSMLPMDEMMRHPGAFGPKLEPPADVDDQTRFLAFLGRKAW